MNIFDLKPNVFIYAMRRSGHHAVIRDIILKGMPWVHYNDIRANKHLAANGVYLSERGDDNVSKYYKHDAIPYNRYPQRAVSVEDAHATIIGRMMRDFPSARHVLVVRDWYNQSASRYAEGWDLRAHIWKEHAALAQEWLNGAQLGMTVILYNNVIDGLGSKYPASRASSFDGRNVADKKSLETRYKQYWEDNDFRNAIADPATERMSLRLFPNVNPYDTFKKE